MDTKDACWSYFVQKCRNNLHVVLAMSPVGETLRTRCRNFPGLVNNTVIDWFEPWPEQALQSVAEVFLKVLMHRIDNQHSAAPQHTVSCSQAWFETSLWHAVKGYVAMYALHASSG